MLTVCLAAVLSLPGCGKKKSKAGDETVEIAQPEPGPVPEDEPVPDN